MGKRPRRWVFLALLAAGLSAFAVFWYAASSGSEGSEPAFGGTYIEGVAGAASRLNPLFASENSVDESLVALLFSGLTRLDDRGQPFPDLAESWDVSQDGRSYTFRLRAGIVWHDSAPFDADDVVFTYAAVRSAALRAPPPLAGALTGATVTKVDALTIRIDLNQPYAPLPAYLSFGILPEHVLASVPPSALFDADFNLRPIGTGPYRLDQLSPERAVLAANAAYHFGQPYIQRFEMRFFRDSGALMTALRDHAINGAFFESGVVAGDYAYLEGRRDLNLALLSSGEIAFVYFNLRNPLFEDRRVRQALLYALDRDTLISEAPVSQASRADSPLAPGTWASEAALARFGSDPTLARALLEEAGYRAGPDGLRARGGQRLSITLATNNDPVRTAVAETIAGRWQAVGVEVKLEAGGTTALVRDLLEPRAFQAVLFGYRADVDPDPYGAWHSSQTGSSGRNLSLLADARFDQLLEAARQAGAQRERRALYAQFQELFAQEVPAIPLYASASLYVQDREVRAARPGYLDNPGARFWQIQDWYVRTR